MNDIIRELDNEGMNLQETILNLKNQGYGNYWNIWLELEVMMTKNKIMTDIAMEILEEKGLLK